MEDILISDHYLVRIYTNFFQSCDNVKKEKENSSFDELDFTKLNYNTSDFDKINQDLSQINWNKVVETDINDFPKVFHNIVYSVLRRHTKFYNNTNRKNRSNKFKQERKIINRKLRKYKKRILLLDQTKKEDVLEKMNSLKEKKKHLFFYERLAKETNAVNKIKKDPKHFYKYASSFKKSVSSPRLLVDAQDNIVFDTKKVSDLLQDQFRSVFSEKTPNGTKASTISGKAKITHPLDNLDITCKDIVDAINEIKLSSSCPSHDIPARVLKSCKETLCIPLQLFWHKSFKLGIIPTEYKSQLIIPLHKKGIKTKAENFRPISLTSHIVKIFERVLRKKLVIFLERNFLINHEQHGFRKNRNCLTQLLSHLHDILSNAVEDISTDCLYIDYSKAFDRVNHDILIKKLYHYDIKGKYSRWIKNFLTGRKQTVLVNNTYSYSCPVTSGVPQGSVLGPLLFVLYINDLPKNVKFSKIYTFAYDTKLVAKVENENDRINLQQDLNSIMLWSEKNSMLLNDNKFDLLIYDSKSKPKKCLLSELPFNNEHRFYTSKNNVDIWPSEWVRDLGVFLDADLSWNTHINNISQQCRKKIGWILSVFLHKKQRSNATFI